MPYIKKTMRERFNWLIDNLNAEFSTQGFTGNLNYILYKIALRQCRCYSDYARFIGELEACKMEVYRRQIASYEELKISENGDIDE